MLFGTKVMAIVGIVAIICAIAAAFVLLNQNNDTSDLSGNWTLYDLNEVDGSILAGLITEVVLTFIFVLVVLEQQRRTEWKSSQDSSSVLL